MTQSAPQTGISLKVTKTINAPRKRVFAAWTQPELLHQWCGAHESFHKFLGPGIEDAWLGPLPPAKVTGAHLPTGPFLNDSDLAFRGVLPVGPGPYLPDESLGLLS